MTLKASITKLERQCSGRSGRYFLFVWVSEGEAPAAAIARTAQTHGIALDASVQVSLWGDDFAGETRHYGPPAADTLIGWKEHLCLMRQVLDEVEDPDCGIGPSRARRNSG